MSKYPNVTVKLILKHRNRVLVLKRQKGVFDFPGGKIEFGETPLETLRRELIEELHYPIPKEPRLLNVWNYLSKNNKRHSIFLTFILDLTKKPTLIPQENFNPLWLTKKEFLQGKIIKNKRFIQKIFNQRKKTVTGF